MPCTLNTLWGIGNGRLSPARRGTSRTGVTPAGRKGRCGWIWRARTRSGDCGKPQPQPSPSPTGGRADGGDYVQEWISQHPLARPGTKELYAGLLRTGIVEDLGKVALVDLTAERGPPVAFRAGGAPRRGRRPSLGGIARQGTAGQRRVGVGRANPPSPGLPAGAGGDEHRGDRRGHRRATVPDPRCGDTQGGAGPGPRSGGAVALTHPGRRVAEKMPPRYRALVLAAAWSGLRQGELMALTRADST